MKAFWLSFLIGVLEVVLLITMAFTSVIKVCRGDECGLTSPLLGQLVVVQLAFLPFVAFAAFYIIMRLVYRDEDWP